MLYVFGYGLLFVMAMDKGFVITQFKLLLKVLIVGPTIKGKMFVNS